ncbi:MAG: glycosyltransferase family 2 protein [Agriterribacter sp.]
MHPTVSVLICVYNDETNIGKAIDSILNQTFQHFEIIVVNDGSTDGTGAVLLNYKQKDKRIKVIDQPNQGTANAANNGIQYCSGKYIARLDSDDLSYSHRLHEEVSFFDAHPHVGLVGGGCHITDTAGRIIGSRNIKTSNPHKTLINRCIYQQSDVMFRKDVLDKLEGNLVYRGKFKGAEDYDLWLRISEVAVVAKINSILGVWKLNTGGYTLSRKEEQMEAIRELKKMAVARRKGGKDWYDNWTPSVKDVTHRKQMRDSEYDKTVALVLLKEGRTREVQQQLKKYKVMKREWNLVKKWYYLSYAPAPLLKMIFGFREFLLNNSSIELR